MKSTLIVVFVNLGLAVAKCSAGLIGHSFALVADGLESSADVLSGLAVYFGLRLAVQTTRQRPPLRFGKAEPIAAVIVALTLVTGAAATAGPLMTFSFDRVEHDSGIVSAARVLTPHDIGRERGFGRIRTASVPVGPTRHKVRNARKSITTKL